MSRPSTMKIAIGAALAVLAVTAGQAGAAPACPSAGFTIVEHSASPRTRPVKQGRRTLFVRRNMITATADLTEIRMDLDRYDTAVQLKFKPEAAARLHDATTNRSGMRIAFVTDDRVVAAVTWTGPYGMDADQGVQLSLGGPSPQLRPVVEAIRQCIGAPAH